LSGGEETGIRGCGLILEDLLVKLRGYALSGNLVSESPEVMALYLQCLNA